MDANYLPRSLGSAIQEALADMADRNIRLHHLDPGGERNRSPVGGVKGVGQEVGAGYPG